MAESAEASRKTTARIVWDTADKYLRNIVEEEATRMTASRTAGTSDWRWCRRTRCTG